MDAVSSFDPEIVALPFFSDEHRRFAEEIGMWCEGHRPLWRTVGRMDPDAAGRQLVHLLGEDGWLAALDTTRTAPPGVPRGLRTVCLAREALAYAEDLVDFAYSIQSLAATPIARHGTAAQQERYLPRLADGSLVGAFAISEREAGSDLSAVGLAARREAGGDWVLDGHKAWIAQATIADLFVVVARTGEGPGALGLTAFLVPADAPGVSIGERVTAIAPRSFGHLRFDACRLPADAVLGRPGRGFVIALDLLERFRMTVGAAAVGFARRASDAALAHTRARPAQGTTLFALPVVRASLADVDIQLNAAALLVARAAWAYDRDHRDAARHSNIAKVHATEAAQTIIDTCLQLFGAAGIVHGSLPERLYRQIRSLRIYEGATDVLRQAIADTIDTRRPLLLG
ncbi:acyl-CoA dehydrogenase family protein [Streptomyces sp. NPDC047315]|uniref:acyl-CoA dehydrogenase family protein n=1 Tax=Streptomyces sp. NPDC047315 TaxID=3155142 RepID=UPI0033C4D49F